MFQKTIFTTLLSMATTLNAKDFCKDLKSESDWLLKDSKVFSKLVGKWKGKWFRYDNQGTPTPYIINETEYDFKTSLLTQSLDAKTNLFHQINYYPQDDSQRRFVGRVVAPGKVEYTNCAGGGFGEGTIFDASASEYGDFHIFYSMRHKKTNIVVYTEDISLTTPNERTRIGRRYDAKTGLLVGITYIVEQRVEEKIK